MRLGQKKKEKILFHKKTENSLQSLRRSSKRVLFFYSLMMSDCSANSLLRGLGDGSLLIVDLNGVRLGLGLSKTLTFCFSISEHTALFLFLFSFSNVTLLHWGIGPWRCGKVKLDVVSCSPQQRQNKSEMDQKTGFGQLIKMLTVSSLNWAKLFSLLGCAFLC